jgi:hypothetical protein
LSTANVTEPVAGKRVVIDAPRLWGGGLATAVVAALVAVVGVLICREVLHVKLVEPPLLRITDSFPVNYAVTAFVLALAATGLAHLLSVITPRPRVFFAVRSAVPDGRRCRTFLAAALSFPERRAVSRPHHLITI